VANKVVEAQRGRHPEFVFVYTRARTRDASCYKGPAPEPRPIEKLHNTAWQSAWKKAGLPVKDDVLRGVHNLRHTFGRRLRAAGIPLETRKALIGHANGDITTHYSVAELRELLDAVERIVQRRDAETPALTLVGRSRVVGKASENEKGLAA
jgi:integrase